MPEPLSCLGEGSKTYAGDGPFAWTTEKSGDFTFYLPKTPEGCASPAVAFAMGSTIKPVVYEEFYKSFASWGIAVAVDPNGGSGRAETLTAALDSLYAAHGHRLGKAGLIGHSQGGYGAINASVHPRVEALVGMLSGQFARGGNYSLPFLGLAAEKDLFGSFTDEMNKHYPLFTGPKFYGMQKDIGHETFDKGSRGDNFRFAAQAWFRCYLAGDRRACSIFAPATCENLPGEWMNCTGENLP